MAAGHPGPTRQPGWATEAYTSATVSNSSAIATTHHVDLLRSASKIAFGRLAYDSQKNSMTGKAVLRRIMAWAWGNTPASKTCFLVKRCAGSKIKFQVPVGYKWLIAQKAIFLAYQGQAADSLDGKQQVR